MKVASQLARYKDELRSRGEVNILMWLVAPHVPHSVREFLNRIGIEYSEFHVAEVRRVADRHGVTIAENAAIRETVSTSDGLRVDKDQRVKRDRKAGIVLTSREFIRPAIHRLWDLQRDWVIRDQLIEEVLTQTWAVERLDADGVLGAEERRERAGNWIDWFSSNYYSGLHNLRYEFERIKLRGTWAYRPSAKASI
jgi:hypothetical protein